jgi:hypothetical protein
MIMWKGKIGENFSIFINKDFSSNAKLSFPTTLLQELEAKK